MKLLLSRFGSSYSMTEVYQLQAISCLIAPESEWLRMTIASDLLAAIIIWSLPSLLQGK